MDWSRHCDGTLKVDEFCVCFRSKVLHIAIDFSVYIPYFIPGYSVLKINETFKIWEFYLTPKLMSVKQSQFTMAPFNLIEDFPDCCLILSPL